MKSKNVNKKYKIKKQKRNFYGRKRKSTDEKTKYEIVSHI